MAMSGRGRGCSHETKRWDWIFFAGLALCVLGAAVKLFGGVPAADFMILLGIGMVGAAIVMV